MQHNHSVGYWLSGSRHTENFIELANLFIRHVSIPKSIAKQYPDYNSGFLAEVSQLRGEEVVIR